LKAADSFHEWIRKQMRDSRPLNEFVAEMVSASGSNLTNGPVNLYTMLVHAPRLDPKAFAADFSQAFLGVQIQCAECHNHPFDRWTMDDYYGFVSFFSGVERKPGVEPRERRIFYNTAAPPAKHKVDGRPMPAKTLGTIDPAEHNGDPRRALAGWLTAPDNELFSRNLANRIWAQVLGRGVIEPVDDVRVSNPPVNGPLLDALSKRLVDSGFDLRSLVGDICNSRVYQLSSQPNASNRLDTRQFSHAYLRRLRADVMMDSIARHPRHRFLPAPQRQHRGAAVRRTVLRNLWALQPRDRLRLRDKARADAIADTPHDRRRDGAATSRCQRQAENDRRE
jgi:hypothetical protein